LIVDQIEIDFCHTNFDGMSHVSLPADILQLFGTGSVPFVVAGAVFGVFKLGEQLASQRAKDALLRWVLTFDVQRTKALPDGTQEIFERIFGERHFSLKCFIRSALFSLGTMAFIGILLLLISPQDVLKGRFWVITSFVVGDWIDFLIWVPWSILIDYVSLFKTRVMLEILTRMHQRNTMVAVAIVGIDYIIYKLIFAFGMAFLILCRVERESGIGTWVSVLFTWDFIDIVEDYMLARPFFEYEIALPTIFFWAGFAPSVWMWLYFLALFVTRGLLRSEKLITGLRWFLDVEKKPFQSIGVVAATLAFITSGAIILVSDAVSQISAAS
jgi:hypothetical protein